MSMRFGRMVAMFCLVTGPAWAAAPAVPASVSVNFPPDSRTLPAGQGMDAVVRNCTACHSVGMILNQPLMPEAGWAAEVAKMGAVYKAPVQKADVPAIVAYLTAIKGKK
jgi:mono/diheme cytochrome c family protein